jgi:hypothetical protein
MGDINIVKRVCGFYVSSMHLVTMILPFIKNESNRNVKFETVLEYNLKGSIKNVLSNLIINDKEKEKILNINWNSNRIQKYSNIEKNLKKILENNKEIDILINGSRKYIEEVNILINKFLNKNKINKNKITIINCYEVREFDDNIREILDSHEFIINTAGVHKIEDIFEDYQKKKAN